MRRLMIYIIVIVSTAYIAILYGSESFLTLFYVELILPVIMILTLIPAVHGISVRLSLPVSVAEQGQRSPVLLRLQNRSLIPGGKLAIQVSCILPMNQRSERTWFFGHIAGRKQDEHARSQIKAEYLPTCVGNIRMEITKVWCYDLLGFIALPLPSKYWKALKAESLLILPKLCEMPVMVSRQSRDFAGESEEYSREKGGDDPSEIFRIRDYQPGDKIRSIHWKLSAKTDGLIVQERSLPLGCPVDLYLNLYQPVMRRNQESINRDSYLLIAASVSHSIVQEGCRHHVIWFDHERGDIRRYRIETEEDVYEMLLRLGRLLTYPQQKDLQDLYLQKYHETPGITCLELHINLSLEKNGVCVQKFHGSLEEIEQQITAKELIV